MVCVLDGRRRGRVWILLAVCTVWLNLATEVGAEAKLSVFSCIMDLEGSFVLNTRETEHIGLYSIGDVFVGVEVRPFRGPLETEAVPGSNQKVGRLFVEEYRLSPGEPPLAKRRYLRIHDEQQELVLYGEVTDSLVEAALQSCERSPLPRQTPKRPNPASR